MLAGAEDGNGMRITTYRTELDNCQHVVLVKEDSYNYQIESLEAPGLIAKMFNAVFGLDRLAEEYVYMLALNTKNKPVGVFEVSHGSVNCSICNPRELFIRALLAGAVHIILVHNHPSGETRPSKEDVQLYNRVKRAGELIGVKLSDSIIIGDGYFSFAEEGM